MLILDNLHSEHRNPTESLCHFLSYLCEGQNFISWCSSDIRQECALPNTFLALSVNPLMHRCEFITPAFFRLSKKFTQIVSLCCSTQETISATKAPLMESRLRCCLGMVHFQLTRFLSYVSSMMLSLNSRFQESRTKRDPIAIRVDQSIHHEVCTHSYGVSSNFRTRPTWMLRRSLKEA